MSSDHDENECPYCGEPDCSCTPDHLELACPEQVESDRKAGDAERALNRAERAEQEAERAMDRREFGGKVNELLSVLESVGLPATFADGKEWVRALGYAEEGTATDACEALVQWLDAGWTRPEDVADGVLVCGEPDAAIEALNALGYPTLARAKASGESLIDLLEAGERKIAE